jgi:hypothetical protein
MKHMKRVLSIVGVVALMATSMVAGNVSADEIGTTLTVETSVAACTDVKPSSISFGAGTYSLPSAGITPTNPPSATILSQGPATTVHYYISTCHTGNVQWSVSLAISDFSSNGNTISAADTVQIRGSRGVNGTQNFTQIMTGGATSAYPGGGVESLMTINWRDYNGTPMEIGRGTATNLPHPTIPSLHGGFTQYVQFGVNNVPGTTPPGTYTADITGTISVAAP